MHARAHTHLHRGRPIDSSEVVDPLGGRVAGLTLLIIAEKHAPFNPGIPLGTRIATLELSAGGTRHVPRARPSSVSERPCFQESARRGRVGHADEAASHLRDCRKQARIHRVVGAAEAYTGQAKFTYHRDHGFPLRFVTTPVATDRYHDCHAAVTNKSTVKINNFTPSDVTIHSRNTKLLLYGTVRPPTGNV